jgi:hypothetical protein
MRVCAFLRCGEAPQSSRKCTRGDCAQAVGIDLAGDPDVDGLLNFACENIHHLGTTDWFDLAPALLDVAWPRRTWHERVDSRRACRCRAAWAVAASVCERVRE